MESVTLFVFVYTLVIARATNSFAHLFEKTSSVAVIEHPTYNNLKRDVAGTPLHQLIRSDVTHAIMDFHIIYDLTDKSDDLLVCRA